MTEGSIRVVLVENNRDSLSSTTEVLQQAGLIVTGLLGGSADSALAQIKKIQPPPEVVITGMRNINPLAENDTSGLELAQALQQQGMLVIMRSAHHQEEAEAAGIPFVSKMEEMEVVLAMIGLMLSRS